MLGLKRLLRIVIIAEVVSFAQNRLGVSFLVAFSNEPLSKLLLFLRIIQVNTRTEPGKTGPSEDRDPHYKPHSTKGGTIPAVRCKACLDMPPVRSNTSIAQEVARLAAESGIWRLEEMKGCGNTECENNRRPIGFHPDEYRKHGKPRSDNGQYYECRRCQRRTTRRCSRST